MGKVGKGRYRRTKVMFVYRCYYSYLRDGIVYEEQNNILAQTPEEGRSLLVETLRVPQLEYFSYNQVGDAVVAISKELVDIIGHSQYERIKKKRNLKVSNDTIRHPTPEQIRVYEDSIERYGPRPFVSKVKEIIMKEYR